MKNEYLEVLEKKFSENGFKIEETGGGKTFRIYKKDKILGFVKTIEELYAFLDGYNLGRALT